MGMTDADIAALGATVDEAPAPRVRAPGGTPGKPARVKDVPLSQAAYESTLAPVRSRLGALQQALGVDVSPEGIILDHDQSNYLTEGHDPDVPAAVRSQYTFDTSKDAKVDKGSPLADVVGEHARGKPFPEFNARWGGFIPEDTAKREEAQRAYDKARLFITKKAEGESPIPESIDKYLFSREDSPARKAYVRKLIADRFREEARQLPAQGGGAELATQARQVADYIETLDPKLLAPSARSGEIVGDLAKHASAPVRRAIKTSIGDALLTGFGNNVAPLTMGLGSMIAKAPGLVAPGGGDTLDPADLAGGGGAADAPAAPVGLPGTRAASGTVGQNVEMMHQAIVENLTGKSPEEQKAYIEDLKREHPIAYHAAAAAGWLADPVGLLGGKAVQGLARAGAAAGLGRAAIPAAVAAVGAPTGIVAGRAAGSENDLQNAALGVAGEGLGQAVGAGARKLLGVAAGRAPGAAGPDRGHRAGGAGHRARARAKPRRVTASRVPERRGSRSMPSCGKPIPISKRAWRRRLTRSRSRRARTSFPNSRMRPMLRPRRGTRRRRRARRPCMTSPPWRIRLRPRHNSLETSRARCRRGASGRPALILATRAGRSAVKTRPTRSLRSSCRPSAAATLKPSMLHFETRASMVHRLPSSMLRPRRSTVGIRGKDDRRN